MIRAVLRDNAFKRDGLVGFLNEEARLFGLDYCDRSRFHTWSGAAAKQPWPERMGNTLASIENVYKGV